MFTQVYFRAEQILGFLSGFTESGPCWGEPQAAAESGEPGRGNNEKQSSEVDSEEPNS